MATDSPSRHSEAARAARRRTILELVAQVPITSQEDLATRLRDLGFAVTQATVSRDIADLGLVKASRGERHVYVTTRALADAGGADARSKAPGTVPARAGRTAGATGADLDHPGELRLRRILADYPVRIARSGLSLVLISTPGTAAVIAQAIDESGFGEPVGTLAGDNTLLVLFADEPALERWRTRFGKILLQTAAGLDGADLAGTYP